MLRYKKCIPKKYKRLTLSMLGLLLFKAHGPQNLLPLSKHCRVSIHLEDPVYYQMNAKVGIQ